MTEDFVEVDGFGRLPCCAYGSEGVQERLAALVIAGRKRATVWDGREGNPTAPGMLWAVMVAGRAVAVIETVTVGRRRFCDIDAEFAAVEGEGDGSLAFWRAAHEEYFRKAGGFDPQMWLWCEGFRLVAVLDRALEAAAAGHVAAEEAEAAAYLAGRG
jgi:uncharacterized protein YhfF